MQADDDTDSEVARQPAHPEPGPPADSTATFAGASDVLLSSQFLKVASKPLPPGSWVAIATLTVRSGTSYSGRTIWRLDCELRAGPFPGNFIGGVRERETIESTADFFRRSVSMTGGAQIPEGGAEISLWCRTPELSEYRVESCQIMLLRVDGFS